MKCPYCTAKGTRVIDKRDTDENRNTRRRRMCLKCKKRFTTFERPELIDLFIIKKDGRRERFIRDKIRTGIIKACEKRPVSQDAIEKAVDQIECNLMMRKATEIPSKLVGELVMKKLKELDTVAYVRFASVYKEFKDIKSFEEELKTIKKGE